jgi:3-hydroxyacyl-CoA dehydrogenase
VPAPNTATVPYELLIVDPLQDITDEFVQKGLARVRDFLQKGVDKGKATAQQRDDVLSRITTTTDRAGASRHAQLVIEAVPEKLELKNGSPGCRGRSGASACTSSTRCR